MQSIVVSHHVRIHKEIAHRGTVFTTPQADFFVQNHAFQQNQESSLTRKESTVTHWLCYFAFLLWFVITGGTKSFRPCRDWRFWTSCFCLPAGMHLCVRLREYWIPKRQNLYARCDTVVFRHQPLQILLYCNTAFVHSHSQEVYMHSAGVVMLFNNNSNNMSDIGR